MDIIEYMKFESELEEIILSDYKISELITEFNRTIDHILDNGLYQDYAVLAVNDLVLFNKEYLDLLQYMHSKHIVNLI